MMTINCREQELALEILGFASGVSGEIKIPLTDGRNDEARQAYCQGVADALSLVVTADRRSLEYDEGKIARRVLLSRMRSDISRDERLDYIIRPKTIPVGDTP